MKIAAHHFYRPRDAATAARHANTFANLTRATIQQVGGWDQAAYFADGGPFDRTATRGG